MNSQYKSRLSDLISKISPKKYGKKDNVNVDWIKNSENQYSIELPENYKWFLLEYDFIMLWGETTKTVFPPDFQEYSDQDIFNYYRINDSKNKLVFLVTEELKEYYFKIVDNKVHDEVYSYSYLDESENLVSNNFISFLIQEIPKNYF